MADLFSTSSAESEFSAMLDALPEMAGSGGSASSAGVSRGFKAPTMEENVIGLAEHGDPERGGGKKKKPKQPDHNKRTSEYWEALGYLTCRVDGWRCVDQAYYKKDLMGIWDMLAIKEGQPHVLIQICAKDDMLNHVGKKLTSSDEAPDNGRPRIDNLKACMACRFRCVFHTWDQPKGYGTGWVGAVVEITEEMIAGSIARKRGPRKVSAA